MSNNIEFIESNGLDVIASGTLVLSGSANAILEFKDFKVEFRFEDNSQNQKIDLVPDPSAGKITIICHKFTDNLGTGTKVPIKIATINSKDHFFHLATFSIGSGVTATRILHYTFMRSK